MKSARFVVMAAVLLIVTVATGWTAPDDGYPMNLPKRRSAHSVAVPATTIYSDVVTSASQWDTVGGITSPASGTTTASATWLKTTSGINVGSRGFVGGYQIGKSVSLDYTKGDGSTSGTLHFTNGVLVFNQ